MHLFCSSFDLKLLKSKYFDKIFFYDNMHKLIFTTLLIALCNSATISAQSGCEQETLEKCANRLYMLTDEQFVFPTNMKEMDKRCQ